MFMKGKRMELVMLGLVLFLALVLRVYRLDQIPPSLNWDEVAAGYNAYTIANFLRDESGVTLPLVFRSFLDDKHPVHIYTTALVVRVIGVSDFNVRLPAALAGVGVVLAIYLLGKIWFGTRVGLLSALFLAVSPYNIHFSRGLWETNFALFFYIFGLYLFFRGLKDRSMALVWGAVSFGLGSLSYHSSKVVVPATIVLLVVLYLPSLVKMKWKFIISLVIVGIFVGVFFLEPRLLGLARAEQNKFSDDLMQSTPLYKATNNQMLGWANVVYINYLKHFTWDYLVERGDLSPRNGTRVFGQFYLPEVLMAIAGLVIVVLRRSRVSLVILAWLLLSPLPSSVSAGAPSATRALFMMGVVQLLAAVGVEKIVSFVKYKKVVALALSVVVIVWGFLLYNYLSYYYTKYSSESAIDFQYGMKQIVEFVGGSPQYYLVYMTAERSQPYIFFLNYLKYPLPDFLRGAQYNLGKSRSYNLVSGFDKYNFGSWDIVGSPPDIYKLYILTPSEYDGLSRKREFEVVKLVKYPDGSDAYFLVSGEN